MTLRNNITKHAGKYILAGSLIMAGGCYYFDKNLSSLKLPEEMARASTLEQQINSNISLNSKTLLEAKSLEDIPQYSKLKELKEEYSSLITSDEFGQTKAQYDKNFPGVGGILKSYLSFMFGAGLTIAGIGGLLRRKEERKKKERNDLEDIYTISTIRGD